MRCNGTSRTGSSRSAAKELALALTLLCAVSFSAAIAAEEQVVDPPPAWTMLWEFKAPEASVIDLGRSVAPCGDINNDGKMDVIAGAPRSASGGMAFILSGADGSVLRTYRGSDVMRAAAFGYSVSPAGDFNGDGTYDILVGAMSSACGSCEMGYAQVLSGADGCPELGSECVLMTVHGATPYEMFGSSVSSVGDLNGDGRTEILVGAPGVSNGYPGAARLFSSIDGSVLFEEAGTSAGNLGYSVAGVGDANGDTVPDFMVGEPNADPGGISNAGVATLYSGRTLRPIRSWKGAAISQNLGKCVAGAARLNKDRYADIILGVPGASPAGISFAGRVRVHSGKDGTRLLRVNGKVASGSMGWAAAAAGDVNGDGKGDIVVGTPGINTSGGRVQVFSGATGAVLFSYDGAERDSVGYAVAVADVNGDLKPEIIIGGWGWNYGSGTGSGYVRVFGQVPTE